VVVCRNTGKGEASEWKKYENWDFTYVVRPDEWVCPELSSTKIRKALSAQDWDSMREHVPEKVVEYLAEHPGIVGWN
jgi:nicotinic acid mononucleotide adenylyltransferase